MLKNAGLPNPGSSISIFLRRVLRGPFRAIFLAVGEAFTNSQDLLWETLKFENSYTLSMAYLMCKNFQI